jgi:hypothetical protein
MHIASGKTVWGVDVDDVDEGISCQIPEAIQSRTV